MGYLYGFIGLSQMAGGLRFNPQIPEGYKYMGVNRLVFGGKSYSITTYKDGAFGVECQDNISLKTEVKDVSSVGTRVLTFYDEDNNILERRTIAATNGYFVLDMTDVDKAVFAELR
jgi:hypothetical protein